LQACTEAAPSQRLTMHSVQRRIGLATPRIRGRAAHLVDFEHRARLVIVSWPALADETGARLSLELDGDIADALRRSCPEYNPASDLVEVCKVVAGSVEDKVDIHALALAAPRWRVELGCALGEFAWIDQSWDYKSTASAGPSGAAMRALTRLKVLVCEQLRRAAVAPLTRVVLGRAVLKLRPKAVQLAWVSAALSRASAPYVKGRHTCGIWHPEA
jgi:hypothetical protein